MIAPSTRALAATAVAAALTIAAAACGGDEGPSVEGNEDLLTSSGFEQAVDAVAEEAGSDAAVLRVSVTLGGAEFQILEGEGASGLIYTGGSLEEVQVDVVGPGTLEGSGFPLSDVDPGAIDRIAEGVRAASGFDDARLTALTLEPTPPDDELLWTINAEGGGQLGLVFLADPAGNEVSEPTDAIEQAQKGS